MQPLSHCTASVVACFTHAAVSALQASTKYKTQKMILITETTLTKSLQRQEMAREIILLLAPERPL